MMVHHRHNPPFMIPASVQIQWPTQQAINLVETSYSRLMLIDAPPTILPCPHSSSPSCISAALANKCMRKERMVGFPAHYPTFMFLLILSFTAQAAGQPAPAPAPSPPPNITAVLEKGGQFQMLIRLLKTTQIDERINSQLNNSNAGLTLFAPSDAAFSSLSPGTLNGLSREQQTTLLQFHVIPTLITISEFQTVSNPISTQAGDPGNGQYPLNVTSVGNQVNITTGLVNTTVSGTVYADDQLAVYRVDEVLLPLGIFRPSVLVRPPRDDKNVSVAMKGPSSSSSTDSADASSVVAPVWRAGLASSVVGFSCLGILVI